MTSKGLRSISCAHVDSSQVSSSSLPDSDGSGHGKLLPIAQCRTTQIHSALPALEATIRRLVGLCEDYWALVELVQHRFFLTPLTRKDFRLDLETGSCRSIQLGRLLNDFSSPFPTVAANGAGCSLEIFCMALIAAFRQPCSSSSTI